MCNPGWRITNFLIIPQRSQNCLCACNTKHSVSIFPITQTLIWVQLWARQKIYMPHSVGRHVVINIIEYLMNKDNAQQHNNQVSEWRTWERDRRKNYLEVFAILLFRAFTDRIFVKPDIHGHSIRFHMYLGTLFNFSYVLRLPLTMSDLCMLSLTLERLMSMYMYEEYIRIQPLLWS